MGGSTGSTLNDIFNPVGAATQFGISQLGGNTTAQNIANPLGGAITSGGNTLTSGAHRTGDVIGPGGQSQGYNPGQGVNFGYEGLPSNFPGSALPQAYANISNLYGNLGGVAPSYYENAISNTLGQQNQALSNIGAEQQTGVGQINNLLNNYNQNFMQQLGPQGQLGQQMIGEFNNYGITPTSGAFQQGLGNTLGSLGAQNALTLGQEAVIPGIQQAYKTIGQGGMQNMLLGSQEGLAPLDYLNQATNMQSGIINQAAELPIQYWQSQNEANLAQSLQQQNLAAQQNASQMGLLGNVLGSGIGAGGMMLAAGK